MGNETHTQKEKNVTLNYILTFLNVSQFLSCVIYWWYARYSFTLLPMLQIVLCRCGDSGQNRNRVNRIKVSHYRKGLQIIYY